MQSVDADRQCEYSRLVHGMAVLTCLVALLPIGMGALTTTLKAGMAFPDWPTSDGYGMFDYPWLRAALDKFVEHGHRLAGMLIGFVSIALAVVCCWKSRSRTVIVLSLAVLGSVSVQGLLGGGRVLADDARMAMFHGLFAAIVFVLMVVLAVITSRRWQPAHANWQVMNLQDRKSDPARSAQLTEPGSTTVFLVKAFPIVVIGQYFLGGLVRHLGTALYEHLAGAAFVFLFGVITATAVLRSRVPALRRTGVAIFGVLFLQVLLGLGAWVTKFGFAPIGYTAVVNSPAQMIVRSSHTFGGMLLFGAAVTALVILLRWQLLLAETSGEQTTNAGDSMHAASAGRQQVSAVEGGLS